MLKNQVNEKFLKALKREWSQIGTCRQTKRFWPEVSLKTSKDLLKYYKREELGWLIQIISGHGFNNYHQSRLGTTADPKCRYCEGPDEETWHLVNECPVLAQARHEVFDEQVFKFPKDITNLLGFINKANISCVLSPRNRVTGHPTG